MQSPRTGAPVANQMILRTPEGEYFQSYNTIIAYRPYSAGQHSDNPDFIAYLHNGESDRHTWDCSATTLKYLKEFLQVSYSKSTIEKMIASGEYQLANLNK